MPKKSTRIPTLCPNCGTSSNDFPGRKANRMFCNQACHTEYRRRRALDPARFWEKVDQSGGPDACWIWTAAMYPQGYGMYSQNNRTMGAHIYSWELANGPVTDGLYVCHNCPDGDNPACVNPSHLFLGTAGDNVRDCHAKGRAVTPKGAEHCRAKLTEDQVREIRQRYAAGNVSTRQLGKVYGIEQSAISAIVRRERWKHVL